MSRLLRGEWPLPNVYDCFMFFNEIDLVELRIRELQDVVDYFVIIEAAHTHTNKPKEYFFGKEVASGKYDDLSKKLKYITIPRFPEDMTSLERENFQRNQITQGLNDLDDDDIIMISDCDEIPSKGTVNCYAENEHDIFAVAQDYYCYYLNCKTPHNWKGTVLARGRHLRKHKPQVFRDNKDQIPTIQGGWHFGYMGGLERIKKKIVSFLHEEFADLSEEYLQHKLENKQDLYQEVDFEVVPLTQGLPGYLLDNQEKFEHLIHTHE
mgnify:FL=1